MISYKIHVTRQAKQVSTAAGTVDSANTMILEYLQELLHKKQESTSRLLQNILTSGQQIMEKDVAEFFDRQKQEKTRTVNTYDLLIIETGEMLEEMNDAARNLIKQHKMVC